jgi:ABC-type multidrug transport system fused ATPase/permease subunit
MLTENTRGAARPPLVRLEQLSYRYPNAPGPVLQDLNFEIRSDTSKNLAL